jgi:hypothetical protein
MKINIDKLFRNKINGAKPNVPKEIWFAVEAELKRKQLLRFLSMFFGVCLISLTGYIFLFSKIEKTPTIKIQKATSQEKLISLPQKKSSEKMLPLTTKKSFASLSDQNNKPSEETTFFEKKIKDTVVEKQVKKIDSLVNNLDNLVDDLKNDLKKEKKKLIKKKDSIDVAKFNKEKRRRWNIIPVLGVSNSGRFSKNTTTLGSLRAVTYPEKYFDDNQSSGLISNILGFNVVFRATNRISIQTGIISKELRFITEGLFLTEFIPDVNPTNIVYNPGVEVRFTNTPEIGGVYSESTSLTQTIVYMEMPFELKYRMFGSLKFNTNLVGGFSFLYLNKNEIRAKTNTSSRSIGRASNVLTTSTSLNIGLDVEYHLSKRLIFNSAVMYKKHYNTYKDYNNKYSPYNVGVHVGIGYKF